MKEKIMGHRELPPQEVKIQKMWPELATSELQITLAFENS